MFNNWITKGLALTVLGVSLTACQTSEESSEFVGSNNEKKEEIQTTLLEQGYQVMDIESYDKNVNVVKLEKDGEIYFGTIDDNFEWLMKPTSEFNSSVDLENDKMLEFSDGLAAVSVPDTREMREGKDLWGFINPKGEWVIEPIYRSVRTFSSDLAIVSTVEEDRDDLSNSRLITIDKSGNEVAELLDSKAYRKSDIDIEDYEGDYAYADGYYENNITHGDDVIYDKNGNYKVMGGDIRLSEEDSFSFIGDKIVTYQEDYPQVKILDLNGNVLNDSIGDTAGDDYRVSEFYYDEFLAKNNLFEIHFNSSEDVIFDTNGNAVFTEKGDTLKYELDSGYAEGLIYNHTENSGSGKTSGTFYDLTGKEMFSVKKMIGPLYSNNRYFVEGKEYYKLVDVEGNTLIDESMKITWTSAKDFRDFWDNPAVNLVKIEYREDSKDTNPKSALLNIESLEVIQWEELLH